MNFDQQLAQLIEDKARLESQVRELERFLRQSQEDNETQGAELLALRARLQWVECEMWENKARRADLTARLKEREQWIKEVRTSPFWSITKPFWRLQRHFLKHRRPAEPATDIRRLVYSIDVPDTSSQSPNTVQITGWCFAHGGPQVVGIRAKLGRKSYFAHYGLERHDLPHTALAYPAAVHSGFSVTVPSPPMDAVIRLEAIAQGGPWEYFAHYSATQSPANKNDLDVVKTDYLGLTARLDGQERPTLYPDITTAEVSSKLEPLIEQHHGRLRSDILPALSIITPVSAIQARWVAEAAASLLQQSFSSWEWCLVINQQQDPALEHMLQELAHLHAPFRLLHCDNPSPSNAINHAIGAAAGAAVCFLDLKDTLHRDALAEISEKLSDFDVVYSDEIKFEETTGNLVEPFFKPAWSPEYFRGSMYVGNLLAVRRELAARVRFNPRFDGAQQFEFMLRLSETNARIGHIAKTLYRVRKVAEPMAERSQTSALDSGLPERAVNEHLERLGLAAEAHARLAPQRLQITPKRRLSFPKVSVIIPTKDAPKLLSACLGSVYRKTAYRNFEVVVVDNDTTNEEAMTLMRSYPVLRLYQPNPFNFSRANNLAAQHASGDYLVFLNNDTEIIAARWLEYLLYYAEQADVGAAGALLVHDNGAVQHAGVVLGIHGTADHAMRGFPATSDGYAGSLSCAREVSAVTAACMAIRKSTFQEIGGFNEHFFSIYQDVDLCLRLREKGLRIIWTPEALLLHHESHSRPKSIDPVDRYLLLDQWEETIQRGDPYYNPNFELARGDYALPA